MSRKGKIAGEEKVKTVRSYLAGQISSVGAVRQGGVAPSTIEDWARSDRNEGVRPALSPPLTVMRLSGVICPPEPLVGVMV